MAQIVRCPHCLSLVYEGDEHCHHCGEVVRKRRIFSKGAILFIFLAVTGFGVFDAIELLNQRRSEELHDRHKLEELATHLFKKPARDPDEFWNGRRSSEELQAIEEECKELREGGIKRVRLHRLNYLGRGDMIVRRSNGPFDGQYETEVRRYRLQISVVTRRGSQHTFLVTASLMGRRYWVRVVSFDFEGPLAELVARAGG